jgi:EAL domain-containing protein (putative c-di-GMP-specific phosphodiesterase class I)/GGDEF domain-containing protein
MNTPDELTEQLRRERDRFVAFSFAFADILLEMDTDGSILFADGATKGLLGIDNKHLPDSSFYALMPEEQATQLKQQLDALKQTHRMEKQEIVLNNQFGDPLPFLLSGFRLSQLHPHIYLTLSLQKGAVPAHQLFRRDVDTGLLNTGSFVEAANDRIREAGENGESLSITLIDFPELKAFLDTLPPEKAEELLHEIAGYLRENSLSGDTAGVINEEAFSFVHDESVEPARIIDDLINITKKIDPAGKGLEVRSQSVAADTKQLSAQDSANVLLYTLNQFAENAGENFNIHCLSESYDKLLDDTVNKIKHFRKTVDDEQFNLAFQPIVDLKSGLIHHYEVLVRMQDPDVFKNPFDFITFGEKSGVISDFDLLMTQKTLEVLKKTAIKGNHPLVAVNLSGKSMESSLFKDTLLRLVDEYKKYRKQVIFELTESSKISDLKSANEFIQMLRQQGNLFCLDDFGTGESSFEYLRNLQVDFIKIDGSYVRESLQTHRGRHMLKAMAALCKDLNVTTIGEMVEDEASAALLWEVGVKFGQGYLFGKPEVDEETIINCKKPTPFYHGMMRAKKLNPQQKKWWAKSDQ